jgi:hypothetical protein
LGAHAEGAYLPFSTRVLWVSTVETKKIKENLERKEKPAALSRNNFEKAPKEKGGGQDATRLLPGREEQELGVDSGERERRARLFEM